MFANPFALRDFPRDECLARYEAFLHARLDDNVNAVETLVEMLPPRDAALARKRYVLGDGRAGKSLAHLRLDLPAHDVRAALLALAGRTCGCFCSLDEACHADVLLRAVDDASTCAATATPTSTTTTTKRPRHA